jgi:hypothetical protein
MESSPPRLRLDGKESTDVSKKLQNFAFSFESLNVAIVHPIPNQTLIVVVFRPDIENSVAGIAVASQSKLSVQ